MELKQKVIRETKSIAATTLYFAACFGVLMTLKDLVLSEYQITFRGWTLAVVGALVAAKVVLVLEHVTLGRWVRRQPAGIEVLLRTGMYAAGVVMVLLLEKAFEARHEYGGFIPALSGVFQHRDMPHVWANSIAMTCALLGFNAFSILREHIGGRNLAQLYFEPRHDEAQESGE